MLTKYKAANSDWCDIGLNRIEQIENDFSKKKSETVEDSDLFDMVDDMGSYEEEDGDFIEEGEDEPDDEDS